MKLTALALATLLAVTGCAADPEPSSSRERRDHARDRTERDRPAAPTASETADEPTGSTGGQASFAAAVYYVADTDGAGVRLYREFRTGTGDRLDGTLELLVSRPLDPDYRTLWRPGSLDEATLAGDTIVVEIDPALVERPSGMSAGDARQAVQQVVYSLQAAAQERLPVRFSTPDGPVDRVLGLPAADGVRQGSPLRVLSLVNLTSPEQGATAGGTLRVSGVGNSFEANVGWEIRAGDRVVRRGSATAEGWMSDRLFPFETSVDLSGLEPGTYTLRVTTDDPSGGTEGVGAMTDDKQFRVA